MTAKDVFKKIVNTITFVDLSIRKKFLLFSSGAFVWLLIVSVIGLTTMFSMNAKSRQMTEDIWPREKAANIVIRKLRGANISIHQIVVHKDADMVSADYRRVKGTLGDSRAYLNTLLKGGQISDYMHATGQTATPFTVAPESEGERGEEIKEVVRKVERLQNLADEVAGELRTHSPAGIEDKISEYDLLTHDAVNSLNNYASLVGDEWRKFTVSMSTWLEIAIVSIGITFGLAVLFSTVFGYLLSRALVNPIKAIVGQIKKLMAGELNLSRRLTVSSKDELGALSDAFNKLMDTIGRVNSFKKVIEEDESVDDIYQRLGRIFKKDLDLEKFVIYEVSARKNTMKVVYPKESEGLELYCSREMQLDCDLCRARRTGHPVSSVDYQGICKHFSATAGDIHTCVPIIIGGNVGGVVQFVCDKPEKCQVAELEKKISKARQYIIEAQPTLEAKRLMGALKESALRDAMTGLYNRRFLEESYENLTAGILRRGTTLGLLMCDLDFFKHTNDQYGHDAGDAVLKETSEVLSRSVRSSDLVIRYGGEEFLVLLIDAKPGDSVEIAEKIRANIEAAKVKITGGFVQKTISIGISEFPHDTQHFWEVVKYADVALYKAKETGRNKVMRFASEMWEEKKY